MNKEQKAAEAIVFQRLFIIFANIMSKGRNKELIRLRDEALCRRYYYWTEIQRLRFDDALRRLSECEFFIHHKAEDTRRFGKAS